MLQLMRRIAVRLRIIISCGIGMISTAFCWFLLVHLRQGAADFSWAIHAARAMLERKNPYDTPLEQYPLTAAIFAVPFVWMPPELAAALFYGISSGFLAFGISRFGWHRLLIFLAYPYWAGLLTAQWSPLILASVFIPLLLPVTMAKPQLGLPVALTHLTRRGAIACAVVLAATFVAVPSWPVLWVGQMRYYEHFVPLLVLPGPLILIALLRYRDRDAQLLLLASVMPQRWFYDAFILWAIPKSRREIVMTAGLSWGLGIWRWYHLPLNFAEVGRWVVLLAYLPMLAILLARAYLPKHATERSDV